MVCDPLCSLCTTLTLCWLVLLTRTFQRRHWVPFAIICLEKTRSHQSSALPAWQSSLLALAFSCPLLGGRCPVRMLWALDRPVRSVPTPLTSMRARRNRRAHLLASSRRATPCIAQINPIRISEISAIRSTPEDLLAICDASGGRQCCRLSSRTRRSCLVSSQRSRKS